VAGMKPKILCAQCGASLQRGNQFCPSCGVAIDWTEEAAFSAQKHEQTQSTKIEQREKKRRPNEVSPFWSFKPVFGIIIIIALAVIMYELFREKNMNSESARQVVTQPMSMTGEIDQKQAEIQELEKNVASHPNDMVLTLQLANSYHDGSSYEKAIPYYKIVLEKNPGDADARVDLGICYKELGKYLEAKKEMKNALKYVPKHLYANFNLGIVCLSEGNLHEANEWFKKTVALDPTSEVGKRAQQLLTQHNSTTPKTN
jgi:tetratricopeptide (TPR) repeat protein